MKQIDIPIIHKTYELYRALHALQSGIAKMERYTVWARSENTALRMLEGFIQVTYLPLNERGPKLRALAADVDMLRVLLRLIVDVKALPLKKVIPLQQQLDEIGRMLGGWIKSTQQR